MGLGLVGLLLSLAAPAGRQMVDRYAVTGAREEMVGLLVRARTEAVLRGGAEVVLDPVAGRAWVEVEEEEVLGVDFRRGYRVEVDSGGDGSPVRLRYDGLGLGRVANRTFRFVRGGEEALLVTSSYGRPARR